MKYKPKWSWMYVYSLSDQVWVLSSQYSSFKCTSVGRVGGGVWNTYSEGLMKY